MGLKKVKIAMIGDSTDVIRKKYGLDNPSILKRIKTFTFNHNLLNPKKEKLETIP